MVKRHRKRKINIMRVVLLLLLLLFTGELIAIGIGLLLPQKEKNQTAQIPQEIPEQTADIYEPTPDPRRSNPYNYENISIVDGILYYEDANYTSELVIDVSAHQTWIDWESAARDGVSEAIIRVGYRGYETGEIHEDEQFRANILNAQNAGIKTGVYFFTQAIDETEAIEEAKFVLDMIDGYDIEGPVAIDMELTSDHDRINNLTVREKTDIVKAFSKTIQDAGYEPMVYGSAAWLMTDYHLEELQDICSIWVANYSTSRLPYDFEFSMWQYNCEGFVYGIDASVDLNIRMVPKH